MRNCLRISCFNLTKRLGDKKLSGVPSVKLIPLKQLRRRYCRNWSLIDRGAIEEIAEPKCW